VNVWRSCRQKSLLQSDIDLLPPGKFLRCQAASLCSVKWPIVGPILWGHSGPFVTHCRCCRGHRCAGGVRQWRRATPGEWQCKIRACGGSQWRMGPIFFKCFLLYESTSVSVLSVRRSVRPLVTNVNSGEKKQLIRSRWRLGMWVRSGGPKKPRISWGSSSLTERGTF